MPPSKAHAKALILEWFDRSGQPTAIRGKVSSGIDRFLDEILKRDSWSECMTVLLGDPYTPVFRASGRDWCATPSRCGLAVSTVVPGWGFGWHSIFKDEYVYDILSWLGHYARQYVHRAQVAKALMIAWEESGAVLHPFGSQTHGRRYGPDSSSISPREALDHAAAFSMAQWGEVEGVPKIQSRWALRNTLDPAIHQAIFHFLRGQALLSSGFELEALVAFDCVSQSLQAIPWNKPVGDPRRNRIDLVATLSLDETDGELADEIYFLRNQFAAHAGGWRWWDMGEYVDRAFMENVSSLAARILRRAADLEPTARTIAPEPTSWSVWLIENFPALFSAIWFPTKTG